MAIWFVLNQCHIFVIKKLNIKDCNAIFDKLEYSLANIND